MYKGHHHPEGTAHDLNMALYNSLLFLASLVDEGLVDVGNDSSSSNGCLQLHRHLDIMTAKGVTGMLICAQVRRLVIGWSCQL